MPLSLYEVTVLVFIRSLKALAAFLEKGRLHGAHDEGALLDARLIADMGGLIYQIQRVSDTARFAAVRVGQVEAVPLADNEKTFADLQERIAKTVLFLEKVDPKSMDGRDDETVTMRDRQFTARRYVLDFAVPNFYFHLTTAYAILRKEGVPVGKLDFLGAA